MRKFVVIKPITNGKNGPLAKIGEIIELSEKRLKNKPHYFDSYLEEIKEPKKIQKKKTGKGGTADD